MTTDPSPSNSALKTSAGERPHSFTELGDDANRIISQGKADGYAPPEDGTTIVSTVPKTEFPATRGVPPSSSNADQGMAASSGLLPIGTRVVASEGYMPSSLANRQSDGSVVPSSDRHRETFDMGMRSFINEARLLAQLDHPELLKVYRFWQERGTTYLVRPCYRATP